MWLFAKSFFCSVVQKENTDFLTVRSRVKSDLDSLRHRYMPTLSPTVSYAASDYPHRATINRLDFAEGLKKIALDIDYDNFKNEVAKKQGHERAHVYGRVWADLLALENVEENLK